MIQIWDINHQCNTTDVMPCSTHSLFWSFGEDVKQVAGSWSTSTGGAGTCRWDRHPQWQLGGWGKCLWFALGPIVVLSFDDRCCLSLPIIETWHFYGMLWYVAVLLWYSDIQYTVYWDIPLKSRLKHCVGLSWIHLQLQLLVSKSKASSTVDFTSTR